MRGQKCTRVLEGTTTRIGIFKSHIRMCLSKKRFTKCTFTSLPRSRDNNHRKCVDLDRCKNTLILRFQKTPSILHHSYRAMRTTISYALRRN